MPGMRHIRRRLGSYVLKVDFKPTLFSNGDCSLAFQTENLNPWTESRRKFHPHAKTSMSEELWIIAKYLVLMGWETNCNYLA